VLLVLCRWSNRVDKYFPSLDEDEWSDEEEENESPAGRPSLGGVGDAAAAAVNPENARSVFGDRSLASSNQQQTVRYDRVVISAPDPHPDSYVSGPPGSASGSVSHRYGSGADPALDPSLFP
jgi:hypothetical protein